MFRKPLYKRVLLKLSGEALKGDSEFGLDPKVLLRLANEVKEILAMGLEVAIVIGGGNLFRGAALSQAGLDRITGDHMGMLATVMNALAMRDVFERNGLETRVLSAMPMMGVVDHYDRRKAMHHLTKNRVVIFAAGVGNPMVTTDSAASLRGIEIKADIILKATNVEGIFSADPRSNPDAKLYRHLTYKEVLDKELGVMDLAAFVQCRDQNIPLRVFDIRKEGILKRVVSSLDEGTLVERGEAS